MHGMASLERSWQQTVDKFKLELYRYLEVMEIEGYGDVDKTFR